MCRPGGALDRRGDVEVRRAGQLGIDAALHAHLGRAERDRLAGPVADLVERQPVGVGVGLALGERAEPAAGVTDVGEVDVAVDDVGDARRRPPAGAGRRPVGTTARDRRPRAVMSASACASTGPDGAPRPPASPRRRRRGQRRGLAWPRPFAQHRPVAVDVLEVAAPVGRTPVGVDRRGAGRCGRRSRPIRPAAVRLLPRQPSGSRSRRPSPSGPRSARRGPSRGSSHGAARNCGCAVSRSVSAKPRRRTARSARRSGATGVRG